MTNDHEPWPGEQPSPYTFEGQLEIGEQVARGARRRRGWRLVLVRAFALLALAALVVPLVAGVLSTVH